MICRLPVRIKTLIKGRIRLEDLNNLDKGTTSVGSKGSDKIVSKHVKTSLWPRRKSIRDPTRGKALVSRAANQEGVPALERINDKIYTENWRRKLFCQ